MNEHRDMNTWHMIHNDGDYQWIVFEYKWVILSKKWTPDVTQKSQLLNLTTKATTEQCETSPNSTQKITLLIVHAQGHDGNNRIMMLILKQYW